MKRLGGWSGFLGAVALLAMLPAAQAHDIGSAENVSATLEVVHIGARQRPVLYLRPTHPATIGKVPALVLLEYLRGTPVDMADLTDASRLVRDYGIEVILPSSTNGRWDYGPGSFSNADDVLFLTQVIDDAIARFPIDPKRVYMGGYSNGGQMTQYYICAHPEKIAGGAVIAGSFAKVASQLCAPNLPTPMVIIHGTDDPVIKYNGNLIALSSPATAQLWAGFAGCAPTPTGSELPDLAADGTTIHLDRYGGCIGNARIDHYTITGGGHTWPGTLTFSHALGVTSQDVVATTLIWDFLSQFSRP